MDWDRFRKDGHEMIDFIADYMQKGQLDQPVLSAVKPDYLRSHIPEDPPQEPESFETIMADVRRVILPGLTQWQHPSFFAFFPANSSPASLLGDLLSSGLGVQGMMWITSPACTELETIMMDWLCRALNMPRGFSSASGTGGGVIQGTASEAALVTVSAARHRYLTSHHAPPEQISKMVLYQSTQAHISVQKSARIAGILRVNLIEVDEHLAMRPEALEAAIKADLESGLIPLFICATVGTTSTTAVDPLPQIGEIARRYNVWLHVDAAYAGSACICPEMRHFINGVEYADSFTFNPHKWMLVNFDCSVLLLQDKRSVIESMSVVATPAYLTNHYSSSGAVTDYRDWQVPLGRRFRSLKLWFVIRQLGMGGLQAHIRKGLEHAILFEQLVLSESRFELNTQRHFALVCFRMRDTPNALNEDLVRRLNATGRIYLGGSVIPTTSASTNTSPCGVYTIRMAFGGAQTETAHVYAAWALIQEIATAILAEQVTLAE